MRKLMIGIVILLLAQGLALGQTSNEHRAWGYVFGGVGGRSNGNSDVVGTVGGGGEALIGKGAGIGGEVAYLTRGSNFSNGIGIASVNFAYHFNRAAKLQPFVTGGGSVALQSGAAGGGNVGGGVQYWMNQHLALRFEGRSYIFSSDSPHTFVFRVGLSFR
jgi:hypothetical protein